MTVQLIGIFTLLIGIASLFRPASFTVNVFFCSTLLGASAARTGVGFSRRDQHIAVSSAARISALSAAQRRTRREKRVTGCIIWSTGFLASVDGDLQHHLRIFHAALVCRANINVSGSR